MAQPEAYDSNAGQWPVYSGFKPLISNSSEIRLLQFEASKGGQDLHYTMQPQDMCSASYHALSYSWGAPVPVKALKRIVIDGGSVLVRPTLYRLLEVLSALSPKASLWIDAICINQNDVEERNQQIAMMGDIYKTAESVYVWLGIGDDDTNYLLDHVDGSNPQTPFNQEQFLSCAEKLFKASYWTRRWVIQEFALARELLVVCGQYVVPWRSLTARVDIKVLGADKSAAQTLSNFQGLHGSGTTQGMSLLQLMQRFQDARCIDRRDRAFALRAVAEDGELLSPDYKESVADVYYRILSQLPTAQVLPEMTGYRFPHQAASVLRECLALSKDDLLASFQDKSSDRLHAVFEWEGRINSVEEMKEAAVPGSSSLLLRKGTVSFEHTYRPSQTSEFLSYSSLPGQEGLAYSLQSSHLFSHEYFIVFDPKLQNPMAIGTIVLSDDNEAAGPILALIDRIISKGIKLCAVYASVDSPYRMPKRILCHISRLALILLWLLKTGDQDTLVSTLGSLATHASVNTPQCNCPSSSVTISEHEQKEQVLAGLHLEILPALSSIEEMSWRDLAGLPWVSTKNANLPEALRSPFKRYGRTDFSFAVEEGQTLWIQHLVRYRPETIDQPDDENRTPLIWAMLGGDASEEATKLLVTLTDVNHNWEDRRGYTPLRWAIVKGACRKIELLLAAGKVNINVADRSGRTPLSWAAQESSPSPLATLLGASWVKPDAQDLDGLTPLLWAAKLNHNEHIKLLLATNQVDYNKRDLEGRTPLSWAAARGSKTTVELLLAQPDIKPDIMDNTRSTPLRWAAQRGHKEIYDLLRATGKVNLDVNFKYEDYNPGKA